MRQTKTAASYGAAVFLFC